MQGIGLLLIAIFIGLFAGGLLGTQPSVNGYLARHLEHPLQATVISFASGTAIILLITMLSGNFPPRFNSPVTEMPWWAWCSGAIGVVMVTTSLILVPRVGSLPWFAAIMCGQTAAALALDHYGWLGNPKAPISSLRLLGASLLMGGVLVIVQAKRMEHTEITPSEPEMRASASQDEGP
ncbi:MAG: DMT family transporter [Rubripirellula sp.]|nr:DMT family transporter [Rubripirellula sp.]